MTYSWKKYGLIWSAIKKSPFSYSHATAPTPILLNEKVIRVFYTSLSKDGIGRIFWVDLDANDPVNVLGRSDLPVLDVGEPGMFDDNGVMALSAVRDSNGHLYLYYAGFELCEKVRYRIFTGLAISTDEGLTFRKISKAPILDRTNEESQFRCGNFVMIENGVFKMWYVAGSSWVKTNGKMYPHYNIRYMESQNGIVWPTTGEVILETDEQSHGFGRPWLIKSKNGEHQMFYSARSRKTSKYSIGFASQNLKGKWIRRDEQSGFDLGVETFASETMMYAALIEVDKKLYCFYNGDNFGESGFALAEVKFD